MQRKNLSFLLANQLAGVFVALLIIFILSALLSPYFLTSYNMSVIARSLAFVGLVTIGQSMLLILGELDLSLGVIGGLCGVVAGMLMMNFGVNPWVAIFLGLDFDIIAVGLGVLDQRAGITHNGMGDALVAAVIGAHFVRPTTRRRQDLRHFIYRHFGQVERVAN